MSEKFCANCSGLGFVGGWFSLSKAAGPDGDAYIKSRECPECKGSGGWENQPRYRMTLNDLRGIKNEL